MQLLQSCVLDLSDFSISYSGYSLCIFKRFYSKTAEAETDKYSNQYKKEYKLTQEQKESLIGIVLADGCLERAKPTHNTRVRVDHAYPEQKEYVLSLQTLFAPLIVIEPSINIRKADSRTGKVYKSISTKTLRFPCLNEYHNLFYKEKIKFVPLNIQNLLTPRGLAHLIMGDGFLHQDGVVIICTESFTKEGLELLIIALESKFDIKASLNKRTSSTGTEGFRIRIRKESMAKLTTLLRPYFIPEMLYKLGV
jgi:hypothetical protein